MTLAPAVLDTLEEELVRLEAAADAIRDVLRLYGRDETVLPGGRWARVGAEVVEVPTAAPALGSGSVPPAEESPPPPPAPVEAPATTSDEEPLAEPTRGPRRRAPRIAGEAIERAKALFDEGQKYNAIGRVIGVSGQTVVNWAIKYGWKRTTGALERIDSRLRRPAARAAARARAPAPQPTRTDRELDARIDQEEREPGSGWVVLPARQPDPPPPASTAEPEPTPMRRCECGQIVALDPCPICQRPWENGTYRARHPE